MLLCRQNPMVIMVFIQVKPVWQTFCIYLLIFFSQGFTKRNLKFLSERVNIFFLHPHVLKSWICFFMTWYLSRKMVDYLFHTSFWNICNVPLFTQYCLCFLHPFYGQMIYYAQLTSSTVERRNNLSGSTLSLSRSHHAMWYVVEMTLLTRSQICMNMQGLKQRWILLFVNDPTNN